MRWDTTLDNRMVLWVLMNVNQSGRRRPHGDKRDAPPVSGSGGDGWKSGP